MKTPNLKFKLRQGDVLVKGIEKIPENAVLKTNPTAHVLAEGEFSGHVHQMIDPTCVAVYQDQTNSYMEVAHDTKLIHDEHTEHVIPAGTYEIKIQRTVDLLGEQQKVMD